MEFTDAKVKAHKDKEGRETYAVWDENLPGFGFRVQAGGNKIYYVKYRIGGKQRMMKIGAVHTFTLAEATKRARAAFKLVDDGTDPANVKEKSALQASQTFGDAIKGYLAKLEKERTALYHWQADKYLTVQFKGLHRMPVAGIKRADVARELMAITEQRGPIGANRARATLSAFFTWAFGQGFEGLENNPVKYSNKNAEEPRTRKLSHAELKTIWQRAPDDQFGDIVRLLMLTMQRRTEIGGLWTAEFNRPKRQLELDGSRIKNGNDHTVPLSDEAFRLIDKYYDPDRKFIFGREDTGYQGWSKSKVKLDEVLKLKKPWVFHDFRRTGKTAMEQEFDPAVPENVSEAILNHAKQGLAKVYNGAEYVRQKRDALDRYAAHLMAIVN